MAQKNDNKVTWPTFPKVVKATCVVLVVVVIFTVVVTAINYGLQELLNVVTNIKGIGE